MAQWLVFLKITWPSGPMRGYRGPGVPSKHVLTPRHPVTFNDEQSMMLVAPPILTPLALSYMSVYCMYVVELWDIMIYIVVLYKNVYHRIYLSIVYIVILTCRLLV